ncbi:MAG TPA: SIR2 family protein [Thermoanaerobaculia bacterium]
MLTSHDNVGAEFSSRCGEVFKGNQPRREGYSGHSVSAMQARKLLGGVPMKQAYRMERDPRNAAAVDRLIQQVEMPRGILPFVGAGLSAPFRFPLWRDFLLTQAKHARVLTKVKRNLAASQYEEAAGRVASALGHRHFDEVVRETFSRGVSGQQVSGTAVAVLPRIAGGPVITTNFDHVLEQVFRDAGRPFDLDLWGARTRLAIDTLAEDYRLLLKLHGDADDAIDRILTQDEYVRHYGGLTPNKLDRSRPLPSLLMRLFASRSVLFLGCSLRGDRYLNALAGLPDGPEHFAVVEANETPEEQADRERFLLAHRITPIWYPKGWHDLLPSFLTALAVHVHIPDVRGPALPVSVSPAAEAPVDSEHRQRAKDRTRRGRLHDEWKRLTTDKQRMRFLDRVGRFLYNAGFWDDYVQYATDTIQAAQRLGRPLDQAELLNNLHLIYKRMGRAGDAKAALLSAQAILDRLPPSGLHAVIIHNVALAEHDAGRYADAAVLHRKALRLARHVGDEHLEPIWRNLGLNLALSGAYKAGIRYVHRALARSREKDDSEGQTRALLALADIYNHKGNWRRMAEVLREALPLTRDVQAHAQVLDDLGVALYHQGDLSGALRCYLDALGHERASDEPRALISTLMNIAWLHFDAVAAISAGALDVQDQTDVRTAALHRSRDYYEQALAYARALRDPVLQEHVLARKSLVSIELRKADESLDNFAEPRLSQTKLEQMEAGPEPR